MKIGSRVCAGDSRVSSKSSNLGNIAFTTTATVTVLGLSLWMTGSLKRAHSSTDTRDQASAKKTCQEPKSECENQANMMSLPSSPRSQELGEVTEQFEELNFVDLETPQHQESRYSDSELDAVKKELQKEFNTFNALRTQTRNQQIIKNQWLKLRPLVQSLLDLEHSNYIGWRIAYYLSQENLPITFEGEKQSSVSCLFRALRSAANKNDKENPKKTWAKNKLKLLLPPAAPTEMPNAPGAPNTP